MKIEGAVTAMISEYPFKCAFKNAYFDNAASVTPNAFSPGQG